MDVLVVLLVAFTTFVLGLSLGAGIAARRFAGLERQRKAALGASAGMARATIEALPTRSAADILSGRIQIVLGGLPFTIPVLPRKASREWLATLDERWAIVAQGLDAAGNDTPEILSLLAGHTDFMLGMLRAYDVNNILPDDNFVDEWATDGEILAATVEVWRAANPLAAIAAEGVAEMTDGTLSEPPSTSPTPTGGDLTMSMSTSPTSS